jgi:Zn-dependent metalloprotease
LNYEVRLPQAQVAPEYQHPDEAQANALLPGLAGFQAGEGAGWKVLQWNPTLGTPSTLGGPAIPMVGADATDESIRAGVEAFVARNADLLRVQPRDMRVSDIIDLGQERKYVIMTQYVDGLEVLNGRVDIGLWRGQIILLGSDTFRDISVNTIPSITGDDAARSAHEGIPTTAGDGMTQPARLVILPMMPNGTPEYHLAWEVFLKTADPDNTWRSYVDAHDARLLWRESGNQYFQITGISQGQIEPETVGDIYVTSGLEDERIRANSSIIGYTDETGNYVVEVPNNTSYSMDAGLYGRWCNANRQDGTPDASITLLGTPGVPLNFMFDDANSHPAERDSYFHVNGVHDWIKGIDPGFVDLDYVMSANVNITSGTCNAFWNGSSVNFYKEGGGCNNSGRIADVIHHEYGHGITQELYAPNGAPNGSGMGEGLADAYAMAMSKDPAMARNFQGSGPLRNGENLRQYPGTECGGEVHCLGEILMGALWKTQKAMITKYGSGASAIYDPLLINTVKTKQTNMPAFLNRMLMTNDTDGNLANGTTDWYEICDAFALHNLPCPPLTNYVTVSSTPLDDQTAQTGPYTVICVATSVGPGAIDPSNVKIFYTTDPVGALAETWHEVGMTPTGNPNEYQGGIPDQGCGKHIRYYVRAAKLTGEFETAPHLAPYRGTYEFMTGPYTVALNDDLEVDRGWTAGIDPGGAGAFERVDPVGKVSGTYGVVQPEDDHTTNPGALCWVTDGRGGGIWNGNDVDAGRTWVDSPTFDWATRTGAAEVRWWSFYFDVGPMDDTLRVAFSYDNGATWTDVWKQCETDVNDWYFHKVYVNYDPQQPFTSQMRVRFSMEDLGSPSQCAEAAFDDVEIRIADVGACAGSAEDPSGLPAQFQVEQNRPNPFNPKTTIRFALPTAGKVEVAVYDAGGRKVRTLVDGLRPAGYQTISWDGRDDGNHDLGSGVYYYTVRAGDEKASHKMMLLK